MARATGTAAPVTTTRRPLARRRLRNATRKLRPVQPKKSTADRSTSTSPDGPSARRSNAASISPARSRLDFAVRSTSPDMRTRMEFSSRTQWTTTVSGRVSTSSMRGLLSDRQTRPGWNEHVVLAPHFLAQEWSPRPNRVEHRAGDLVRPECPPLPDRTHPPVARPGADTSWHRHSLHEGVTYLCRPRFPGRAEAGSGPRRRGSAGHACRRPRRRALGCDADVEDGCQGPHRVPSCRGVWIDRGQRFSRRFAVACAAGEPSGAAR